MKIEIDSADLEIAISQRVAEILLPQIEKLIITRLFDYEIKGYKDAAKMLGIPPNTLKSRLQNGRYKECKHYIKKGTSKQSQVIFFRDDLYNLEKDYILRSKI